MSMESMYPTAYDTYFVYWASAAVGVAAFGVSLGMWYAAGTSVGLTVAKSLLAASAYGLTVFALLSCWRMLREWEDDW
ncbi:hypothetical protein [Haloarchaeobius sp. DFWS5]|uniref:hypothetical protein n=1 Tax=Haloarchaeobius sp. DFWS5 TaxID=3446114 RepID=UPI003EBC343E